MLICWTIIWQLGAIAVVAMMADMDGWHKRADKNVCCCHCKIYINIVLEYMQCIYVHRYLRGCVCVRLFHIISPIFMFSFAFCVYYYHNNILSKIISMGFICAVSSKILAAFFRSSASALSGLLKNANGNVYELVLLVVRNSYLHNLCVAESKAFYRSSISLAHKWSLSSNRYGPRQRSTQTEKSKHFIHLKIVQKEEYIYTASKARRTDTHSKERFLTGKYLICCKWIACIRSYTQHTHTHTPLRVLPYNTKLIFSLFLSLCHSQSEYV